MRWRCRERIDDVESGGMSTGWHFSSHSWGMVVRCRTWPPLPPHRSITCTRLRVEPLDQVAGPAGQRVQAAVALTLSGSLGRPSIEPRCRDRLVDVPAMTGALITSVSEACQT